MYVAEIRKLLIERHNRGWIVSPGSQKNRRKGQWYLLGPIVALNGNTNDEGALVDWEVNDCDWHLVRVEVVDRGGSKWGTSQDLAVQNGAAA